LFVLRDSGGSESVADDRSILEDGLLDPAGPSSRPFLRHNQSLNSLSYLVDREDTRSLRNLFDEILKDDTIDLDEDITFARPDPAEGEEYESDDSSLKYKSYGGREGRRRSIPFGPGRETRTPAKLGSSPLSSPPLSRTGPPIFPSPPASPVSSFNKSTPPRPVHAGPLKEVKRNSLSSFTSFEVEHVAPDGFQQRRKRAAKLTKFFGADYRSLFGEVLESIETDVNEDRKRGSLTEEEAEELLGKLQRLKAKQDIMLRPTF